MATKKTSKTKAAKATPVEASKPAETPAEAAKEAAPAKAKKESKPKKLSALSAAAQVLGDATQPMTCPELIDAMSAKGLWTSPNGATPHSTLYAAMQREINAKGAEARFVKTDRGKFTLRPQA